MPRNSLVCHLPCLANFNDNRLRLLYRIQKPVFAVWTDWKHWIKFTACTSAFREGHLQHLVRGATQISQDITCSRTAAPAQAQKYQVRGEIPWQSWSRTKSIPSCSPALSTEKSLCKSFPFITDFQHPFPFTTTLSYRLNSCRVEDWAWHCGSGIHVRSKGRHHQVSHPRCNTCAAADTAPLQ